MVAVLAQNIKLSVTIFSATNEKTKCACCLKAALSRGLMKLIFFL
jgi:hypothetical protein